MDVGGYWMKKEYSILKSTSIVKITMIYIFVLYIAWIGAWLLERWLSQQFNLLQSIMAQSIYWLLMKLLLWILPSILLIHLSGRKLSDVIGFKRMAFALQWGVGVGLFLGVITIITRVFAHKMLFTFDLSWTFLSGVIVSPIVEEITFRGALMGVLQKRFRFAVANLFSGLMFVGAHLPGWYFQGTLLTNLLSPVGGALSIFLLGLVFGYVAHRSQSVAGSVIAHMLNNFFNS